MRFSDHMRIVVSYTDEEASTFAESLAKVLDIGKALVAKLTPAGRDGFSLPAKVEVTAKVEATPGKVEVKPLSEIHKTDEEDVDEENAARLGAFLYDKQGYE